MVPVELRYASTHEWCRVEGDHVLVGLTEYAAAAIGNVIYVELPEAGDDVLVEVPFGEIEGLGGVKDLISPTDGRVVEVNSRVVLTPDLLAKDPYDRGWLIRVKPDSLAPMENLLSAADYEERQRKRKGR